MSTPFIDHLVLPVESLSIARRRWTDLGFNVAADAVHPFGTANACIFLSDGTYLEPLAVHDGELAENCRQDGNGFVARDAEFRLTGASEGFSAFVLRSSDSDADHARFADLGISGAQQLAFSRNVIMPSGELAEASFRLAFAELASSRFFAFTCQRINTSLPTSGKLVEHSNGAVGLASICLGGGSAEGLSKLKTLLGVPWQDVSTGRAFELGNCVVIVRPDQDFNIPLLTELTGVGIRFRVQDIRSTQRYLDDASISYRQRDGALSVEATKGQGCIVEFVE